MKIPKIVVLYTLLIFLCLISAVVIAEKLLTAGQIDIISKLTPAFVTFVIGSVAGFIAWRQAKTAESQRDIAREKLRLDLFDKRYQVVEQVREAFSMILHNGGVDENAWRKLREIRGRSTMLFGSDVEEFLDDILNKAKKSWALSRRLNHPTVRSNYEDQMADEFNELFRQFTGPIPEQMEKLFQRYVRFPDPH